MEQRKYDHATAKAIFEMICWPECWVIRDKGVFVEDGFRLYSPRDKAFDWTPAYEMDWPGAPNPMTAPTLPIDFTARELAASMIDGVGRQIQEALNRRIGYALDDDALQGFGSYQSWVREALTEAYDVARQAQDVVGELDRNQQQRADDLSAKYRDAYSQALEREKVMEYVIIGYGKDEKPEYGLIPRDEYLPRLARAKESVAVQKAQAEQAEEQADAAFKAWRKAMVRQLLQPQAATPSPAPVPQVAPPVAVIASGGVVTDKAGPGWSLKSIQRVPGYRWPLYRFLEAAHTARQACPKAQHVLDAWKLTPPNGLIVIQLPTRDELEYELETGAKKRATAKQIQAVIKGLLSE